MITQREHFIFTGKNIYYILELKYIPAPGTGSIYTSSNNASQA